MLYFSFLNLSGVILNLRRSVGPIKTKTNFVRVLIDKKNVD